MPEGHSVHRIANRFDELFAGQQLAVTSPQGRFAAGAARLDGHTMLRAIAVGKQMFCEFDGDLWLRVHLGIYGAWDFSLRTADVAASARMGQTGEYSRLEAAGAEPVGVGGGASAGTRPGVGSMGAPRRIRVAEEETAVDGAELGELWPPPPVGAVRVRLLSQDACADLRGPTACEVLDPAQADAAIAKLGPDPLVDGKAAGRRRFAAAVSRRRTPIGALLMDQAVVAGIGNIYRAEMLFRAGINPFTPGSALTAEQIDALWDDWCRLLPIGVETGVIVTRTRLRGNGRQAALQNRQDRHFVYGRAGEPCRVCGIPVALDLMQNRKLYWCPSCQPR